MTFGDLMTRSVLIIKYNVLLLVLFVVYVLYVMPLIFAVLGRVRLLYYNIIFVIR